MTAALEHAHTWEADPGDSSLVQCKVCGKLNRSANIPPADQARCFAQFIGFSEFFAAQHARYSTSRKSYARGAWQVFVSIRPELREFEEIYFVHIDSAIEELLAAAGGGVR